MLFGAITMTGGQAARAMPHDAPATMDHAQTHAMPAGHCAGMASDDDEAPKPMGFDCAIACSVILGTACEMSERIALAEPSLGWPMTPTWQGLNPEHEPPPPRLL